MEIVSDFKVFMEEGGIFMYIIMIAFFVGIAIIVERFNRFRVYDLNAPSFMNEIQKLVLANKIRDAIQYCSGSKAMLPQVIKNGLKRSNQGSEQIQNAIDATALEIIPAVEKRMHYLSMIANICTLLGLLGTIQGLIMAFDAVGAADPAQKAEVLSKGISTAMNTTALGLVCAILIMVLHSLLTDKSEKIISEVDQYSVKLLDILGTMKVVDSKEID